MKGSTAILFALLALGGYLLYRSIQNVGYAVNSVASAPGELASSAYSTLQAEYANVSSSLASPLSLFSGLGTSISQGAASLFGGSTTTSPSSLNSGFLSGSQYDLTSGDLDLSSDLGGLLDTSVPGVSGGTLNILPLSGANDVQPILYDPGSLDLNGNLGLPSDNFSDSGLLGTIADGIGSNAP